MSNEGSNRARQPLHVWLTAAMLKFLVFLAFAFVLFAAMVGIGERDLSSNRVWVIMAGMAGLLLLLAIDRLTALRVSPGGLEATLAQAQAQALEEVSELEDREVAETARAQILQAESPDQVQAAMAITVELNVNRVMEQVKQAIHQKRKVYVRYRPDPQGPVETYQVAPLDLKPGKTPATRANDYLWVYSYEHESVISLRLGQVLGVELSEETFDPVALMADWKQKERQWNVPREW
jgi:predicted DNA-binding transcriptional regulator YafY